MKNLWNTIFQLTEDVRNDFLKLAVFLTAVFAALVVIRNINNSWIQEDTLLCIKMLMYLLTGIMAEFIVVQIIGGYICHTAEFPGNSYFSEIDHHIQNATLGEQSYMEALKAINRLYTEMKISNNLLKERRRFIEYQNVTNDIGMIMIGSAVLCIIPYLLTLSIMRHACDIVIITCYGIIYAEILSMLKIHCHRGTTTVSKKIYKCEKEKINQFLNNE